MAVTIVPGEASLRVTQLRPRQSASVQFTPQEGVIQVTAFAVQVGATKPKGKPERIPGEGRPGKPGAGEGLVGRPGVGEDISVPQDASVTASLIPPGASTARKSKTFRTRDALGGGGAQEPLELGVMAAEAGKPWTCRFTNAGRTEARVTGTVRFVKERQEQAEEPPAEVSVGAHADSPVHFLRPADSETLRFKPAQGLIQVSVFAAETKGAKPSGKLEPFPEGGDESFEIKQNVRVHVELSSPAGLVASRDFRSTKLLGQEATPVIQHVVPEETAEKEWRVRFTNRGRTDIRCAVRVTFVGKSLRSDIPLRVLNNGLRQLIAGIALTVRLDGKTAFIGVSDELAAFASGSLGGSTSAPIDFSGEFSDVNLFAFGVRARTDTGRPLITAHARFETRGEEIDDFQLLGFIPTDLDIGRLAITLDMQLRAIELKDRRVLEPITTLKVDVSAFAEVLGFIGANASSRVIDEIEGKIREVVDSGAFRGAVAKYLTAGLVYLVQQGHEFQDLLVEPNRFVVLHVDPTPGQPPQPSQPPNIEFPRSGDVQPAPIDDAARANLEKIDHIVVLMQENRSFDHLLGYLSHPEHGLSRLQADPDRDVPDGLTGDESNPRSAGGRPIVIGPYPTTDITILTRTVAATAVPYGPHHEHDHVVAQIDEGTMRGFADDFISRFPNADPQFAMRFYTAEHLPVFDALAASYTICDRWFCSHPGPTQPNRFCTLSGHTPVLDNFAVSDPILGYLRMTTMFDVLSEAGIDWTYYEGDIGFLRAYDRYRLDDEHVIPYDDVNDGFLRRAELGLLPPVTFIDPNFTDVPPAKTANDDHAPADLRLGQQLVREVHDALAGSVHWNRTLFVITYDEHGGFFDHVAPPGTPPSEQPQPVPLVHPDGDSFLGPRTPTFVISPFVRPGKVNHTVFDHTSIMATILHRYVGQVPAELGPRPAAANDLAGLLDLDDPRRPAALARTPSAAPRRFVDTRKDPGDFHASMRSLAQPKAR